MRIQAKPHVGQQAMMKAEAAEMGSAPSESEPPSDTPRAPRHGLNAKALLMQAAVLAAEEAANIEETVPETLSAQKQQIAHLKSAFASSSKLLAGIPKRETPVIAFVNHAKVSQAHSVVAPGNISYHGPSTSLISWVSRSADPSSYTAAGVAEVSGSTSGNGSYRRKSRTDT